MGSAESKLILLINHGGFLGVNETGLLKGVCGRHGVLVLTVKHQRKQECQTHVAAPSKAGAHRLLSAQNAGSRDGL